jgi:mannose-1-phosphate guanylyltransferase
MKAFLLAAGVGSRLRPITDTVPKCMVAIDHRPLLDIWLDAFDRAGVDEVLINLHHLPEIVGKHLAARSGPPVVRTVFERELLGSAGTLAANREWIADEEFFLACNADNLTDFDLSELIDAQRARRPSATIAVFHAENPSAGGVVELDADGIITGFEEKPAAPVSDLTNAGIYALRPSVLDYLNGTPPLDIGYHLLPRLVGMARTVSVPGYFRDIGTVEAYQLARKEWGNSHDHHADAIAHRSSRRWHGSARLLPGKWRACPQLRH